METSLDSESFWSCILAAYTNKSRRQRIVLEDATNYQPLIWRDVEAAAQIANALEGEADAIINAKIREMQNARIVSGEVKYRPLAALRAPGSIGSLEVSTRPHLY